MLYFKGLVMGLAIAAPVGPIGLLCIRQTLNLGWRSGFLTGLGAATADAIYGAIAAFGITAVSALLLDHQFAFGWIGGIFLIYLGFKIASSPASTKTAQSTDVSSKTLVQHYGTAVALTLTNPATILSFAGIFIGLGLGPENASTLAATVLVGGVFTGSALWWLFLSGSATLLRHRITDSALVWINRGAGGIIGGFGLVAIILQIKSVY